MDLQKYREMALRGSRRAGPGLMRIFVLYVGVLAVLSVLAYFLENPVYEWRELVLQYAAAGNPELPTVSPRAFQGILLARLMGFLGRIVTVGWVALSLGGARGQEYSWHDLWAFFPRFWKVLVISLLTRVLCALALCLFILPGIFLFYSWRLSFYVLAEHPDWDPLRCMRQSRRLMVGERLNLFRLDLSCLLLYGLAALLFFVTSGILRLWRMPALMMLYAAFYNDMVFWKEPPSEGPAA